MQTVTDSVKKGYCVIVLRLEVASAPQIHLPAGILIDTDLLVRGMPLGELGATTSKLRQLGMRTPRNLHERREPLLRAIQFGRTSWARVRESLQEAGFRLDDFPCLVGLTRHQIYVKRV